MKDFGIGALSRDTGCAIETIRYYERIGIMPAPPRSSGGHRSYAEEHKRRLRFIVRSRAFGFSLAEIRELLALVEGGVACGDVKGVILSHIDSVRSRIAELTRLLASLEQAVEECKGGATVECAVISELQAERTPVFGPEPRSQTSSRKAAM